MEKVLKGYNAGDISEELRIPIHVVFRRIADARAMLTGSNLIEMARDLRITKNTR